MAGLTEETGQELLEALGELHGELRRIKRQGLTARLSEAEQELIAHRVYEMVDERLAPQEARQHDQAPGERGRGRYFERSKRKGA